VSHLCKHVFNFSSSDQYGAISPHGSKLHFTDDWWCGSFSLYVLMAITLYSSVKHSNLPPNFKVGLSLTYWVIIALHILWTKSWNEVALLQIFSSSLRFAFSFAEQCFQNAKFLNSMMSNNLFLSCTVSVFCVLRNLHLPMKIFYSLPKNKNY